MTIVTEPGIHYDLLEAEYHADPVEGGSLSQSGAKLLLEPAGPARYLDNLTRKIDRPEFAFGRAAHELVLGVGASWVEAPYPDFRKKEAREWRDEQVAAGLTVVSATDAATIREMAAAIRANACAMDSLQGIPEVSMFDQVDGVWMRGRVDVLGDGVITDYKTSAAHADARTFAAGAARYGYHMQVANYLDMARGLGLDVDRFRFVVQEKQPPYLVSLLELDEEFIQIGRERMARARAIYRECRETGIWPGYPNEVQTVAAPAWCVSEHYSTLDPQLESELLALTHKESA